jgi:hypothetical protein
MEGILLIAALGQQWKLRLASDQRVEPKAMITLRPKYGMRMVVEARGHLRSDEHDTIDTVRISA